MIASRLTSFRLVEVAIIALLFVAGANCEQDGSTQDCDEHNNVTISRSCAAFLISGGVAGGAAAVLSLPSFLGLLGFSSIFLIVKRNCLYHLGLMVCSMCRHRHCCKLVCFCMAGFDGIHFKRQHIFNTSIHRRWRSWPKHGFDGLCPWWHCGCCGP